MPTMDTPVPASGALPRELRELVDRAARRMMLADLLFRGSITMTIGIGLLAALAVAWKLGPWMVGPLGLSWAPLAAVVLFGSVVAAAGWTLARAPRGALLADEIDRRTGLRERLSTAYYLSGSTGAGDARWAVAVTEDASERARRVVLRDAIPVTIDARSARPPLIALVVFVLAFLVMPRYDLTGALAQREEEQKLQEEAERVAVEIEAQEKKIETILRETSIDVLDGEDEADASAPEGRMRTPEEIRRRQVRKLTRVSEALEKVGENEQARTVEAMRDAMRRLKEPPPGPLMEFQRQLARGNFGEAKASLEKLEEQLNKGELSEEEREQLTNQALRLGEQLAELSEQRESLEKTLREAGMSREQAEQAARDPNALDRALEKMPGIPAPEQLAMRRAAQAQQNASQAMESMAHAAQQMAQSAQQSGAQGQQGSQGGAAQMGEALSAMDAMASEQAAASEALQQARSQLQSIGESMCEGGPAAGQSRGGMGKQGAWAEGEAGNQGNGSGGPGRGRGGSMQDRATDFVLKNERANVNTGEGPIIASTLVFGSQLRGESRATFSAATAQARAQSAEAIESMRVPREFHEAVQSYFGRLEQAAEEPAGEDAGGSDAE